MPQTNDQHTNDDTQGRRLRDVLSAEVDPVSTDDSSKKEKQQPEPKAAAHPRRKWLIIGGVAACALIGLCFLIPWLITLLNTVSTDDAYVNGHVTFVAARVSGHVVSVWVDDNNQVQKGDLLVKLDKEPYEVAVRLKTAIVSQARADLLAAQDQARGQVALVRSNRFKLIHAMENVNNQIAQLRANVAALGAAKARQIRAQADYDRAKDLAKTPGAISQQDLDLKLQDIRVAESQTKQALETVYQSRVGLGLPAQPKEGKDLTEMPPDLDQTFSTVRTSVADMLQSQAPLGIFPSSYQLSAKQTLAEFDKRDPQGRVDQTYAKIMKEAPAIKQAEAKLQQAEQDLEQAKLNLSYCSVYAEIDGVVTRRNVNPGNNVDTQQMLMAVRSLKEIWIDANFKESQLSYLRIGQRVRCVVDMYGTQHEFEGRITGFSMGTGAALSLLPPQNATGNFVKIVQRLPVRVELTDYHPEQLPLFVGLSVVPYVYYKEAATGPHAGDLLQPAQPLPRGPTPTGRDTKVTHP